MHPRNLQLRRSTDQQSRWGAAETICGDPCLNVGGITLKNEQLLPSSRTKTEIVLHFTGWRFPLAIRPRFPVIPPSVVQPFRFGFERCPKFSHKPWCSRAPKIFSLVHKDIHSGMARLRGIYIRAPFEIANISLFMTTVQRLQSAGPRETDAGNYVYDADEHAVRKVWGNWPSLNLWGGIERPWRAMIERASRCNNLYPWALSRFW